ncbi:hypothetical protein CVD25_08410 [Bacillus canaveralius]|uniref:DUF3794 domain-containing protein n=1 Tax=Bacillus canaveralius TaxID=1403243 RepID=A0A2N5GIF9_9BACI|nr:MULTISPECIES: hypothetical protein [Bacillus]PLR80742.1 hypothetical protein CU635_16960 [Bacillus canaveralius]PLR81731.1 hypothetical protein CVD23_18330 [Bacillus sp. V33-4]PLR98380.1 hypothetical protein CVD25_08410 [Bacillus canaveralius]
MQNPAEHDDELLCINTEKVYDWVILQSAMSKCVPADALHLDTDVCKARNLKTRCILVDPKTGHPLGYNSGIKVEEIGERDDRPFIIGKDLVELQRVTFTKKLCAVIEFSGIIGKTPFVEISKPITIEMSESLFLCAPKGTRLMVKLADSECTVRLDCDDKKDELLGVDLTLNVCQSIQTVADVTVELFAAFCQPRDILTEQCPTPKIPKQCNIVFPGDECEYEYEYSNE